eukprot:Plantae.Rhodophyta-Purpureofilum_apyrenoidigerum.ctg7829.p2 GENE.Plantae.Rhodophyta-Purpureofilum_apyrenoidigerum.ctg7829~~Plantae.Rhodophyta-Purpureofilum_apyrenoidigerum.ctg7829.p2  ORF type:complete len:137 (-),score=28.62 Plantae.Rhodophyta-Purpureofilum_apyrenoidigerum.ctg7829:477-887(-)
MQTRTAGDKSIREGADMWAVQTFMSATRQYARRQLQWFRNEQIFMWMPIDVTRDDAAEACAQDIMWLLELPRKEYDELLASCDQAQVRERCISEGKGMKKYISRKNLILPGSDLEMSLICAAEEAADLLFAKGAPL